MPKPASTKAQRKRRRAAEARAAEARANADAVMADEGQEAAEQGVVEQGVAEQGAVRITSVRMRVWSEEPQDMATLRQLAISEATNEAARSRAGWASRGGRIR